MQSRTAVVLLGFAILLTGCVQTGDTPFLEFQALEDRYLDERTVWALAPSEASSYEDALQKFLGKYETRNDAEAQRAFAWGDYRLRTLDAQKTRHETELRAQLVNPSVSDCRSDGRLAQTIAGYEKTLDKLAAAKSVGQTIPADAATAEILGDELATLETVENGTRDGLADLARVQRLGC